MPPTQLLDDLADIHARVKRVIMHSIRKKVIGYGELCKYVLLFKTEYTKKA